MLRKCWAAIEFIRKSWHVHCLVISNEKRLNFGHLTRGGDSASSLDLDGLMVHNSSVRVPIRKHSHLRTGKCWNNVLMSLSGWLLIHNDASIATRMRRTNVCVGSPQIERVPLSSVNFGIE